MALSKMKKVGSVLDEVQYDLGTLTASEEMWLRRHRLRRALVRSAGHGPRYAMPTQDKMAEAIGISRSAYARLEGGRRALLSVAEAQAVAAWIVKISPTLGEICFVARRRSGMSLSDIRAEATFAASKPSYLEREAEGHPDVVSFWAARGFRFPTDRGGRFLAAELERADDILAGTEVG